MDTGFSLTAKATISLRLRSRGLRRSPPGSTLNVAVAMQVLEEAICTRPLSRVHPRNTSRVKALSRPSKTSSPTTRTVIGKSFVLATLTCVVSCPADTQAPSRTTAAGEGATSLGAGAE